MPLRSITFHLAVRFRYYLFFALPIVLQPLLAPLHLLRTEGREHLRAFRRRA